MNDPNPPTRIDLSLILGFYVVMSGLGWGWVFIDTGSAQLPLLPESGELLPFIGAALACAAATIAITPWLLKFSAPMRTLALEMRALFEGFSRGQVLAIALASGIGEEIFFRVAMQNSFGLLWTSVVFGLLHGFPTTRFAHWGAFAFFAGLAFGVLQEQSSSVLPPALAHISINYWNLRRIIAGRLEFNPDAAN